MISRKYLQNFHNVTGSSSQDKEPCLVTEDKMDATHLIKEYNQVIYIRAPATVIFFFFLKTWLFYEHKILKIGTVEYWDRFPDIRNLSVPYRFKREKVLHPQLLVFVWKIYMYVKTGLEKMIVHEIAILNKK